MRSRLLSIAGAIVIALTWISPAGADTVWYSGYAGAKAWITLGTYDPDCYWYYGQARCSGGNNWRTNEMWRASSGGTGLVGFENNERVRGIWSYSGETYAKVHPGDLGMCCYVYGETIWWSGGGLQVEGRVDTLLY